MAEASSKGVKCAAQASSMPMLPLQFLSQRCVHGVVIRLCVPKFPCQQCGLIDPQGT